MLTVAAFAGAAMLVSADAFAEAGDIVAAAPEAITAEARWSRFERDRSNALLAREFAGHPAPREDASARGAAARQNHDDADQRR
jgi:hypothetical protein